MRLPTDEMLEPLLLIAREFGCASLIVSYQDGNRWVKIPVLVYRDTVFWMN